MVDARQSPRDEIGDLMAAARVIAGITAESLAQAGERVTLPQLRVLMLTSGPGPVGASAVAEALDVHLSSASRICDRLVQAGLLDRRENPADRRQIELTPTQAGRDLLAEVIEHRRQVFARILRRMADSDRDALAGALAAFVAAAQEYDERRSLVP